MSEDSTRHLQKFITLRSSVDFLFVVFFRGHWCPFCMSYLKSLATLEKDITAAGGKTLIVTAEAEEHLAATLAATGYQGESIVDPENRLAKELDKRGKITLAISEKNGYPHGMVQPGILVIRNDGTVVYEWAIQPSVMNLGGAKDRPSLPQVWDNVHAQMQGKAIVHQSFQKTTFFGMLKEKIFG